MLHYRKLYRLVQAVACMGGLALPGVASAANFTFIAVLNSGQEIQPAKPNSNSLGTALLTLSTTTRLLCYSISYTEPPGPRVGGAFPRARFGGTKRGYPILYLVSGCRPFAAGQSQDGMRRTADP